MAVDKQTIMEKLFAEKPLTNEEILHIGSKLDEQPVATTTGKAKKKKAIPFNHSDKISLTEACGLRDEDFKHINKLIKSEVMDNKALELDSMVVEVYEKIGLAKPQNFRLLMYQFVKMRRALQKASGIGMRLGGDGGSGGLDDFLNFLKGRM